MSWQLKVPSQRRGQTRLRALALAVPSLPATESNRGGEGSHRRVPLLLAPVRVGECAQHRPGRTNEVVIVEEIPK